MPSIAGIRTKYETKKKNRFNLIMPLDVGGASLQASVRSSARPKWTVSEKDLHHLNTKWFLAGKADWETWTCAFYDFVNDNTLKEMFKWYNLVYNPSTTLMSTPDVYKKDVIVQMLGPGLEGDTIEEYTLYSCWPTSIDGGDLDMTSDGEVAEISVTFRFDYAVVTA
jgi:hypothetical protein